MNIENGDIREGTSKQTNVLDEMIFKLAEVNSNSADLTGMQNLRHFGKIVQVTAKLFLFLHNHKFVDVDTR